MIRVLGRILATLALVAMASSAAIAENAPPANASYTPPPPMLMYPGDRVAVKVQNYPDFSESLIVDTKGFVNLAAVGKLHVRGLDADSVETLIRSEIWKVIPSAPLVRVYSWHRVSVLGEVKNPGLYQVDGTERVADLIARAGGTTPSASLGKVRVNRDDGSTRKDLAHELSTGRTLTEVGLMPGDIVYVPTKPAILDWRNWAILASGLASVALLVDRVHW